MEDVKKLGLQENESKDRIEWPRAISTLDHMDYGKKSKTKIIYKNKL